MTGNFSQLFQHFLRRDVYFKQKRLLASGIMIRLSKSFESDDDLVVLTDATASQSLAFCYMESLKSVFDDLWKM